jgi:hypothetical protein
MRVLAWCLVRSVRWRRRNRRAQGVSPAPGCMVVVGCMRKRGWSSGREGNLAGGGSVARWVVRRWLAREEAACYMRAGNMSERPFLLVSGRPVFACEKIAAGSVRLECKSGIT